MSLVNDYMFWFFLDFGRRGRSLCFLPDFKLKSLLLAHVSILSTKKEEISEKLAFLVSFVDWVPYLLFLNPFFFFIYGFIMKTSQIEFFLAAALLVDLSSLFSNALCLMPLDCLEN